MHTAIKNVRTMAQLMEFLRYYEAHTDKQDRAVASLAKAFAVERRKDTSKSRNNVGTVLTFKDGSYTHTRGAAKEGVE
jgi:hypothetical protein